MPWTDAQDRMLREFYEQYPADQQIPVKDFAAMIGKNLNTVRSRAFKLGISQSGRPRGNHSRPIVCCPICGAMFKATARTRGVYTRTCSLSCAGQLKWQEHEHPRGATGIQFSDETKAVMRQKGLEAWKRRTPEQVAAYAENARRTTRLRLEHCTAETTHTRGRGGRRPDVDNMYFRSSWEANYARWLNYRKALSNDSLTSWLYEPKRFDFPVQRGTMSYTPDFQVFFGERYEWHEVKGWLTPQGATAIKRFALYYPDEPALIMIDAPVYRSIASIAKSLIVGWETRPKQ